ncbi:C1 family peptidase [Ginsengibacter hankyongi]|uniref:C1 family peptidase n=1 Tax=Ginsengibacter hankyongi TaxID=2607284 RepID=A0A5J5IJL0_9BACT|nr:C1 family peptidase [Ginsengibacter hankyongi]KAA9041229.1 C1 family peptidase [Ginsengibacter hankyongi]
MGLKNLAILLSFPMLTVSFLPGQNVFNNKNKTTISGFSNNPMSIIGDWVDAGLAVTDTTKFYTSATNSLPPAVTLDMPVPGDQGKQSSCGTWAAVYGAGSYYMHRITGKPYSDSENLSPAFIYNQLPKSKSGVTALIDNFKLFKTKGACPLNCMPYNANDYLTQPDSTQCRYAGNYKIKDWKWIDPHNLILLKRAIFEKKPVIFSITTDEGFDKITPPFIWKDRCGPLEQLHSMVICGYDDTRNSFLVMNSWGTSWGDKGFIWIDYQFFLKNASMEGYILI